MQAGSGSQSVLKLAIEQYEQIIKIEPDSVDDHLLLGRLYRLNNDLTKAEEQFKTAVKLQPDSEEAVTTLAYLYNEEGDTARATQVLSSIPDASRSAKLYSALGYTYEQQKQYKEAITAYRRAIELDRDNLDAIRGLAQNLLNDGQTDAALEQYKVIADANPEDAQTYLRIAEIYRKNGKFEQALDSLKKAQTMNPFARKSYVQRQSAPIRDRVNELDELTAANSKMIKDVDSRAQQGIQLASTKANEADQHAIDAGNKATMANQTAQQANTRLGTVEQVVTNIDQYQASSQTEIRFKPGQTVLSKNAKEALDQMATAVKGQRGYIIEVQGFSSGHDPRIRARSRFRRSRLRAA